MEHPKIITEYKTIYKGKTRYLVYCLKIQFVDRDKKTVYVYEFDQYLTEKRNQMTYDQFVATDCSF